MKDKPKIQIQFPSFLVILVIAVIGSILKMFGFTQYDWLHVIMSIPIAIYFMWCVGYCILAVLGVMLIKLISKR